jgi:adenylate cyclase class IV
MEDISQDNTLDWKRPDQVMKLHKFKLRKFALQARFSGSSNCNSLSPDNLSNTSYEIKKKRKNPFLKYQQSKKLKESPPDLENDSADSTFDLLNLQESNSYKDIDIYKTNSLLDNSLTNSLELAISGAHIEEPKGKKYIPIDWTLKTKLRLMCPKPFSWKGKIKASEEASGTTAFVRRLDIGEQHTTLDTSPNARFHQCCLVWQHPSIPWIELFPRSQGKLNISNNNFVSMNQFMKDALYKEWCSSFRSLFHLLRVRQCPYFYVCGNNFTVLFRAAGICGISEVQALLTPTTRGLRESLKNEEIQYTMPLKSKRKKELSELNIVADDDEQNDKWLKSVGIEESEIRKISFSQSKVQSGRECDVDNLHESLIFVTGVEAQALFNFLINCKTLIISIGPHSGIPPTLLSPIAFHGASLRPLRVRESVVSNGKEKFYSLELTGPILPDVLPSLCSLMTDDQLEKFSVSCAQLTNTNAFTLAKHGKESKEEIKTEKLPQNVFGLENLTDCGFNKCILSHFCNPDQNRIENFESLTCENNLYTWS